MAIAIQTHILLLVATPPTVVTITIAPHLLVLSVHEHNKMLPMISALKVGDSQPIVNKVALLAIPPLSPLYIAGATAMARSPIALDAGSGGLLLRTIAALSIFWSTTVVAYMLPATTTSTTVTPCGVYGLASSVFPSRTSTGGNAPRPGGAAQDKIIEKQGHLRQIHPKVVLLFYCLLKLIM